MEIENMQRESFCIRENGYRFLEIHSEVVAPTDNNPYNKQVWIDVNADTCGWLWDNKEGRLIVYKKDLSGGRIERYMTNQELIAEIERMIDEKGLTAVVDAVCEVCYAKAEHVRASYSDTALAEQWDKAGASLVQSDTPFPS